MSGPESVFAALCRGLRSRTPDTVLKHVLGADANLVARLCRALIWGGRSQRSGLTIFPIRLSERSRNRTPPCSGNTGPVLDLVFRTFRTDQETPLSAAPKEQDKGVSMVEDVPPGPGQTTDYRSMCDSLIGNGSAKWHAQQ